jgi:hypothetical protein
MGYPPVFRRFAIGHEDFCGVALILRANWWLLVGSLVDTMAPGWDGKLEAGLKATFR